MVTFLGQIKDEIEKNLFVQLDEIKDAFNKKIIQLFIPKVVLDIEKLFQQSHAKMEHTINDSI